MDLTEEVTTTVVVGAGPPGAIACEKGCLGLEKLPPLRSGIA